LCGVRIPQPVAAKQAIRTNEDHVSKSSFTISIKLLNWRSLAWRYLPPVKRSEIPEVQRDLSVREE
jgi:hypothetical protein